VQALFEGDQPRLCPEGPFVTFVRGKEGDHDVYIRDLRDGREVQVTSGPADDLNPDFQPNCEAVVFSRSEAPGKGYDIWRAAPFVHYIERLTDLPGDEMVPRLSPIIYSIQGLHPETCGGPVSSDVTRYGKIVFVHRNGKQTDIRFVSDDGMVQGLVREKCEEATWTADGLGMLFRCGGELLLTRADQLNPGSALSRIDPGKVSEASRAIEAKDDGDYYDRASQTTDRAALLADPLRIKLFLSFGKPTWTRRTSAVQVEVSVNQALALAVEEKGKDKVLVVTTTLGKDSPWTAFPLASDIAWPAWGPDGQRLYFSCNHGGFRKICAVDTTCPLQGLQDLVDYPELTRDGLSARLAANGFAARTSEDKEFFHILEKARYAERGILVTPDMLLQAFADSASRLSQEQEKRQARLLLAFLKGSLEWVRRQAQGAQRGPWRHLAVGLAVPAVLLETGIPLLEPRFEGYYEPPEEERETPEELAETARMSFDLTVTALTDEWFREDVVRALELLDEGKMVELREGDLGIARDTLIDFSMAVPRGHYDAPGFRQYFKAVTWLGLWPLPVDSSVVRWSWWLATPCGEPEEKTENAKSVGDAAPDTGDGEGHGEGDGEGHGEGDGEGDGEGHGEGDGEGDGEGHGEGDGEGHGEGDGEGHGEGAGDEQGCPADALEAVDRFAGAMAGPAALPGLTALVRLVRDRWGRSPMGNPPNHREVAAELKKVVGTLQVRTLEDAVGKAAGTEAVELFVLPKRLSEDSVVWKRLTHPDIEMRGIPAALDMMAVLGAAWVESLVLVPEGETWRLADWLGKVRELREQRKASLQSRNGGNLNDRWLARLADLAALTPSGKLPRFMEASAYRLRLLMSALAGLAQVKHQMVLYSFQNYGVECDGWSPIVVLYEQPVKPRPAAYVEPVPDFYRGLAALCRDAAEVFGGKVTALSSPTDDCPELLELGCQNSWDDSLPTCPGTCLTSRYEGRSPLQVLAWVSEVLAGIADKELAGKPLDEWEYNFVRYFGATLEELFLVQEKRDSGMTGADQGRQERGIALVADVYTNVQRQAVLHEAVGKPFLLFAHVPFDGRERIVLGAMLSFYEFTHPTRLNDAQWWEMVTKEPGRVVSYLPSWAAAFIEN
jgi:hypothetical protein